MSQLKRSLEALVKQRLSAAAEEISGLFERTIAEYEEELCRSQEENERQRKLLDAVFKPQLRLHRADVQQLSVSKEVPPEQQERSPSLDQKDPPELPRIKEEQEGVWTGQEGEQLQEMETEEAAIKFTVTLMAEDDAEKKPAEKSSKLIQTGENRGAEFVKTEADVEICGGPEPARTSDPGRHLQPDTRDKMAQTCGTESAAEHKTDDPRPLRVLNPRPLRVLNPRPLRVLNQRPVRMLIPRTMTQLNPGPVTPLSPKPVTPLSPRPVTPLSPRPVTPLSPRPVTPTESDTDDSSDWGETTTPQSNLNPLQNDEEPVSDLEASTEKTSVNQSERDTSAEDEGQLQNHDSKRETEKSFSCSFCCKRFGQRGTLTSHIRTHTGEKPFPCSDCGTSFKNRGHLTAHMRTHTGERPYSCSVCGRGFAQRGAMKRHLSVHTEIQPVSCTVCVKKYKNMRGLKRHMKQHLADESSRDDPSCSDACSADGSQQV